MQVLIKQNDFFFMPILLKNFSFRKGKRTYYTLNMMGKGRGKDAEMPFRFMHITSNVQCGELEDEFVN